MAKWLYAEYRDFHLVPRMMICTCPSGTYLFCSRFVPALTQYSDHYEVYRLPPLRDGQVCASWFGLETTALERLADLPVQDFPFDLAARVFLDYDAIAPRLRSGMDVARGGDSGSN